MDAMKVTVDIDCTPEEARRFMGLPDLSSVHAVYLAKMERMIDEGISADNVDQMVRAWSPMGDAGVAMWRQMIEQISGAAKR
jgi:hypothetical protein